MAKWEAVADRLELGKLGAIPGRVLGRIDPERNTALAYEPTQLEMDRIITTAVERVQEAKSVFTRHDVFRRINDELPPNLGALSDEQVHALVDRMTDVALSPAGPADVRLLNAPDVVLIPAELRDADGRSVYLAPNAERYTTAKLLDDEQQLISEALRLDAPRIHVEPAAEAEAVPVEAAGVSAEAVPGVEPTAEGAVTVEAERQAGADEVAPPVSGGESEAGETQGVSSDAAGVSGEATGVSSETLADSEENSADSHENDEGESGSSRVRGVADDARALEGAEGAEGAPEAAAEEIAGQEVVYTPEEERLIQAHRDAAAWFQEQLHSDGGQEAREYMDGRGFGHAIALDSPWQVGYGGTSRYALFNHLSALGYSNEELMASGLVLRTEGGGIIDRFRGRVVLPVHNAQGDPVAFMGRKLPDDPHPAKWLNSPETAIYSKGKVLMGLGVQRQALAAGAQPVIVEGLFDVLAVAGASDPRYVAVAPGGTAFTTDQYAALTAAASPEAGVLVAFDDDKAGRKASVAAYELLRHHEGPVRAVTLPEGMDPGDLADDPERLREVLQDQERHLVDVVVAAGVDAHRWPAPSQERPQMTGEEISRQAAESWGFDPVESEARHQQYLSESAQPGPDLSAHVARSLARTVLGVDVPAPAPEAARPADHPRPEADPYREGDLTVEAQVEAIRQAVDLIDLDAPDAAERAQRVMAQLAAQTGADLETVQAVFVDALAGEPLPVGEDAPNGSRWGQKTIIPSPISAETQAAWRETDRARAAEQAAAEAAAAASAETGEGEAERAPVSSQTPRVSEETARALRESAQVRAELMELYPRLHVDQADAIAGVATSGRGVDVLVGPAGSGKSTTLGYLADLWKEKTSAPVVGLATAQNAANILGAKKVNGAKAFDATHNIAKWLYLVESGKTRVVPGSLIVVDEASMVTTTHLKEIQDIAAQARAKVVWAGDHAQLSAPGAAGAMRHLVELGGAYELTKVHRFAEAWEAEASLKLRDGMAEALTAYDKHGRLAAGSRADMEAQALRSYLADYLDGKDTLLLASTNESASALSGRARAALVEAGLVEAGGTRLRDANTASVGDLIVARANDTHIKVGEDQRPLSNRDVLRVVEVLEDGGIRATLREEDATSDIPVTLPAAYVADQVELAYAGTTHAAQGRDVHTCYSIVDGTVTDEMLYVMMTRGQEGNYGYGVVEDQGADLRTGPEQAQEYTAELRQAGARQRGERLAGEHAQRAREADEQRLGVFAAAMQREAVDPMATEAMLGEAERPRHLGHLGAMWLDMTREYTARGYLERAAERGVLAPHHLERALKEEALSTLGRMLTRLEMAGYPADTILDQAISSRELGTAEEISQVLYWRIDGDADKHGIDVASLDPSEQQINATWSERTTDLGVPAIDVARHDIAQRMDERTRELAERAAHQPPRWLVEHIGPVPADTRTRERDQWMQRAGRVLAYREQWMHQAESDAIGPAPSRANPEQRAAWLAAHDALGAPEGVRDLSGASLGELYVLRAAYERETRWAPAYVAEELRAASLQARELDQQVSHLRAEARQEQDDERRVALEAQAQARAELAQEMHAHRQDLERIDAARQRWYDATEDKRVLAERADQELRRRAEQDAQEQRQARVDVGALRPLALDGAGGREYEEAQARRAEQAEAEERAQVHPGQMSLDDIEVSEPAPEVVDAEPVEAEPVEAEAVEAAPTVLEIEAAEPEVTEHDLVEADQVSVAWEAAPTPEFDQHEFTASGVDWAALAASEPEPEVVDVEPVEAEPEPAAEQVQDLPVVDAEITMEVVERITEPAPPVQDAEVRVTVVEIANEDVPDPWRRPEDFQRDTGAAERDPDPVAQDAPSADQPTLWDEVIDHTAEMDRVIDQARHAADLADHRNAGLDAERLAQEEADREQRQREAREVDAERAAREEQARQELEQREAERAAAERVMEQQLEGPEL
ncbi:AAA family ATPase [Nocardiopsis changdeensis]|uniref:AAA family ATPase n=1 Tax=Nocardiopsis changdeensis TaxID=2831969 RepID=UPI003B9B0514